MKRVDITEVTVTTVAALGLGAGAMLSSEGVGDEGGVFSGAGEAGVDLGGFSGVDGEAFGGVAGDDLGEFVGDGEGECLAGDVAGALDGDTAGE